MKVFGSDGLGFFAVHSVICKEICDRYGVAEIGKADNISERFYAITPERNLRHEAVAAIATAARTRLFATVQRT